MLITLPAPQLNADCWNESNHEIKAILAERPDVNNNSNLALNCVHFNLLIFFLFCFFFANIISVMTGNYVARKLNSSTRSDLKMSIYTSHVTWYHNSKLSRHKNQWFLATQMCVYVDSTFSLVAVLRPYCLWNNVSIIHRRWRQWGFWSDSGTSNQYRFSHVMDVCYISLREKTVCCLRNIKWKMEGKSVHQTFPTAKGERDIVMAKIHRYCLWSALLDRTYHSRPSLWSESEERDSV